jgi:hypothetical protein
VHARGRVPRTRSMDAVTDALQRATDSLAAVRAVAACEGRRGPCRRPPLSRAGSEPRGGVPRSRAPERAPCHSRRGVAVSQVRAHAGRDRGGARPLTPRRPRPGAASRTGAQRQPSACAVAPSPSPPSHVLPLPPPPGHAPRVSLVAVCPRTPTPPRSTPLSRRSKTWCTPTASTACSSPCARCAHGPRASEPRWAACGRAPPASNSAPRATRTAPSARPASAPRWTRSAPVPRPSSPRRGASCCACAAGSRTRAQH